MNSEKPIQKCIKMYKLRYRQTDITFYAINVNTAKISTHKLTLELFSMASASNFRKFKLR